METFLRNGIVALTVIIVVLGIVLGMLLYIQSKPARDLNNATLVYLVENGNLNCRGG